MTIYERIQADFLSAFKQKQAETLSTLRLLKSALKNAEIEARRPLTEEEVLAVVKSQMKQLSDALESYTAAGRTDLMTQCQAEIQVLEGYLPEQLSDEALQQAVATALSDGGFSEKSQMGQAMGAAMKAVNGRADGSRVRAIVQTLLASVVLCGWTESARAATGIDETFRSISTIEVSTLVLYALRFGRVALVLMGIMAILLIVKGAFQYMLASGRSDDQGSAFQSMAGGMLATMFVTIIFAVATIVLEKLV